MEVLVRAHARIGAFVVFGSDEAAGVRLGFVWGSFGVRWGVTRPYAGDHHELKFMVQGFEKQERREAKAQLSLCGLGRETAPPGPL